MTTHSLQFRSESGDTAEIEVPYGITLSDAALKAGVELLIPCGGQGRANALYVLFYYIGGWLGITCSGLAYKQGGWGALILTTLLLLIVPIAAGIGERRTSRHSELA